MTEKVGKFITFEGGEGTGKSTQTVLLADYLNEQGHQVVLTREPGGSDGAELIRALLVSGDIARWSPMTEVLLLYAARAEHWSNVIEPALAAGAWVICDRFADSTLAYQGYGHGVDRVFISKLYASVIGFRQPDWTFVFDLDPAIGVERALKRHTSENRFEHMDMTFHNRVREGFLKIAHQHPERCHIVDATQSVYAIHKEIALQVSGA
ncbi:MAG: dTMP kinase [Alphaproteobacteria bacterium]|jgi:dTMP kinase|nr:dTMP kinase [Alphaproteobacteria bacterium]